MKYYSRGKGCRVGCFLYGNGLCVTYLFDHTPNTQDIQSPLWPFHTLTVPNLFLRRLGLLFGVPAYIRGGVFSLFLYPLACIYSPCISFWGLACSYHEQIG